MVQIRPWLYIGTYWDTLDRQMLISNGINTMFQLGRPVEQKDIISLYLTVDDGVPIPDNLLQQGVHFIRREKHMGNTVLIACEAGISRSVSFAISVLKEEEELNLLDAFHDIRQRHPSAMPHPALWKSLCTYYDEHIPLRALYT